MNLKTIYSTLAIAACLTVSSVNAAEYTVGQKNKEFTENKLAIKVGDTVRFTNEDTFFHNVFSLSEVKTFDLGSYPKGESKTVTFQKEGIIEVECAIHPNMHMAVEVTK